MQVTQPFVINPTFIKNWTANWITLRETKRQNKTTLFLRGHLWYEVQVMLSKGCVKCAINVLYSYLKVTVHFMKWGLLQSDSRFHLNFMSETYPLFQNPTYFITKICIECKTLWNRETWKLSLHPENFKVDIHFFFAQSSRSCMSYLALKLCCENLENFLEKFSNSVTWVNYTKLGRHTRRCEEVGASAMYTGKLEVNRTIKPRTVGLFLRW